MEELAQRIYDLLYNESLALGGPIANFDWTITLNMNPQEIMDLIHRSKRIFIWRLDSPHLARIAYSLVHTAIGQQYNEQELNGNQGAVLCIRLPLPE